MCETYINFLFPCIFGMFPAILMRGRLCPEMLCLGICMYYCYVSPVTVLERGLTLIGRKYGIVIVISTVLLNLSGKAVYFWQLPTKYDIFFAHLLPGVYCGPLCKFIVILRETLI